MIYRSAAALLSVLTLAACATVMDSQFQEVKVLTPGAEDAYCLLDNGVTAVRAWNGQTVTLVKNDEDLKVDCWASGNRERHLTVNWTVDPWVVGNVVTAGAGVVYDHFTNAMYISPDTITVDFSGEMMRAYPAPEYERMKVTGKARGNLEEYKLGKPMYESERDREPAEIRKRDESERGAHSNPFAGTVMDSGGDGPVPLTPIE